MQRPHGQLHAKGNRKGQQNQRLLGHAQRQPMPGLHVETVARSGVQIRHGHHHEERAHEGVEEKFEGRVDFARAAPNADDDVHGHQCGFEEDVEQQRVLHQEGAIDQAGQRQQGAHELVETVLDVPASQHHQHGDEGIEQHQPQRDAINSQMVVAVDGWDPLRVFDKLHARFGIVETGIHLQRQREDGKRCQQRTPAHYRHIFLPGKCHQRKPGKNWRPDQ